MPTGVPSANGLQVPCVGTAQLPHGPQPWSQQNPSTQLPDWQTRQPETLQSAPAESSHTAPNAFPTRQLPPLEQ